MMGRSLPLPCNRRECERSNKQDDDESGGNCESI